MPTTCGRRTAPIVPALLSGLAAGSLPGSGCRLCVRPGLPGSCRLWVPACAGWRPALQCPAPRPRAPAQAAWPGPPGVSPCS